MVFRTIITFCQILLLFLNGSVQAAEWSYVGNTGPSNWQNSFHICGLKTQSPINIDTTTVQVDSSLGRFDRSTFYTKPTGLTIKNNGHTVQVDVVGGYDISDSSLLPGTFRLDQFHFHWADAAANGGSEHTLNGRQYFGEMHAVFYNTKYADIGAAVNESDGLAVLGFFIDPSYAQDNCAYDRIIEKLSSVSLQNQTRDFNASEIASLETLFPSDISKYYRYSGSLTTPPCYESVTWTVFKEPVLISQAQAGKLATLMRKGGSSSSTLNSNYRPVQALNERIVRENSSAGKNASIFLVSLFSLLSYIWVF